MTSEPNHTQSELRLELLQSFSEAYAGVLEAAKVLEGKAQASITIAGIFFAAAFAYVRDMHDAHVLDQSCLTITMTLLSCSVVSALLALRISHLPIPPLGDAIAPYVLDLIQLEAAELTTEHLRRYDHDRLRMWQAAVDRARLACRSKAAHVWRSQILIAAAMVPILIVTVTRLVVRG